MQNAYRVPGPGSMHASTVSEELLHKCHFSPVSFNQGQVCLPVDVEQHLQTFTVVLGKRKGSCGPLVYIEVRDAVKPSKELLPSPQKNLNKAEGETPQCTGAMGKKEIGSR